MKVFGLKAFLSVVAAVGDPKPLEKLVFVLFFCLVDFSANPAP